MTERSAFPVSVEEQRESVELSLTLHQMAMFLQVAAAFGHGAGGMKATTDTMEAIYNHYLRALNPSLEARWEHGAHQALERVIATGRLAALKATEGARSAIEPADFEAAALSVERVSMTIWCPPNSGPRL